MSTAKQVEANRRNAAHSTGPRTEAGKERSKLNALTHGLTAKTVVIEGEDPEVFEAMRHDFFDELAPASTLESQLVDRLAGLVWRLRRIPEIEASLIKAHRLDVEYHAAASVFRQCGEDRRDFDQKLNDAVQRIRKAEELPEGAADMSELDAAQINARKKLDETRARLNHPGAMLGRAFRQSLKDLDTIGQLTRYERELVRNFDTTLTQLERARKNHRPRDEAKVLDLTPVAEEA